MINIPLPWEKKDIPKLRGVGGGKSVCIKLDVMHTAILLIIFTKVGGMFTPLVFIVVLTYSWMTLKQAQTLRWLTPCAWHHVTVPFVQTKKRAHEGP